MTRNRYTVYVSISEAFQIPTNKLTECHQTKLDTVRTCCWHKEVFVNPERLTHTGTKLRVNRVRIPMKDLHSLRIKALQRSTAEAVGRKKPSRAWNHSNIPLVYFVKLYDRGRICANRLVKNVFWGLCGRTGWDWRKHGAKPTLVNARNTKTFQVLYSL